MLFIAPAPLRVCNRPRERRGWYRWPLRIANPKGPRAGQSLTDSHGGLAGIMVHTPAHTTCHFGGLGENIKPPMASIKVDRDSPFAIWHLIFPLLPQSRHDHAAKNRAGSGLRAATLRLVLGVVGAGIHHHLLQLGDAVQRLFGALGADVAHVDLALLDVQQLLVLRPDREVTAQWR